MAKKNAIYSDIPIEVDKGGTGAASHTQHGVLLGQGTNPVTTVGPGTAGYVLTSNGAGADPSFQDISAVTQGSVSLLDSKDATGLNSVEFINFPDSNIRTYIWTLNNLVPSTTADFTCDVGNSSGTFYTSNVFSSYEKYTYSSGSTSYSGQYTNHIINIPSVDSTANIGVSGILYLNNVINALLPPLSGTQTAPAMWGQLTVYDSSSTSLSMYGISSFGQPMTLSPSTLWSWYSLRFKLSAGTYTSGTIQLYTIDQ
jgi:hypothetical protein